jgi:hypothetical protein
VSDEGDLDRVRGVIDVIHHAVIADADAVQVVALQFLATGRSGVLGQSIDAGADSSLNLFVKLAELGGGVRRMIR